jgi:serine/threonine-protein kinase
LPLRLGAWICARVADGLHAAHELNDSRGMSLAVIHRDVNPYNIFLTHGGEVKLIDFGLAKARERRTTTKVGIVKGKSAYFAPESVLESGIDRRVDIFALGTTLWEAGTMQRLFKRETDYASVQAILKGDVPDPRSIVTGYPDDLYAVVLCALKRDRDERYATAAAMRDDLEELVANAGPVSAAGVNADMSRQLAALVTRLFPGEAETHASWRREAARTEVLMTVSPPPVRVRGADADADELAIDEADLVEIKK